ncbi:hypothetical protein LIER_24148 [Lithospermum erythrorhizon]|uniref:Uncharacterized protein n=1 Tax=Lithospermum erythrorhizon TaxID=34254 RepID=A0AAV3R002_LITER
MADSISSPDKDVTQVHHDGGESHGLRDDLNDDTPINDVKAPNVFERAKEEIEAIVESIQRKKEQQIDHDSSYSHVVNWDSIKAETDANSGKDGEGYNFIEKAKEELASLVHKTKSPDHHHDDETHGRNDDIDENTPIDEVKGPNVFVRAKDEIEALIGAFKSKRESNDSVATPKKHDGFGVSIGKSLEKMCSPRSHKHDD